MKALQSNEILLQFAAGLDVRLILDEKEDFLNLVKMMFPKFNPKDTLKVYGIPGTSLKAYKNTGKHNFETEPEAKFRLLKEEIPGQNDLKKQ